MASLVGKAFAYAGKGMPGSYFINNVGSGLHSVAKSSLINRAPAPGSMNSRTPFSRLPAPRPGSGPFVPQTIHSPIGLGTHGLGMMGTAAMGAVTGGLTSSMAGGDFITGALGGATLGLGLGATGFAAGKAVLKSNWAQKQLKKSPGVANIASQMTDNSGRIAAMGAGAGLVGFTMGATSMSHKRGFNKNRGNDIRR